MEDMPQDYTDDLAWQNVEAIAEGLSAKSWTAGRLAYWSYYLLFQKGLDIAAAYSLASLSGMILIIRAYIEMRLIEHWEPTYVMSGFVSGAVFAIPAVGVVAPVAFVLAGRYAVRCAEESIEDNMAHLARRMRAAAQEDIDAKLEKLRE